QRVDVLAAVRRTGMTVREGGDRDAHRASGCDADGAGVARHRRLLVRSTLGLYPIDQLSELRGALQVAEERLARLVPGRGIAAQREEAQNAGIQELADEARSAGVGVAHAREVRERL